MGLASCGFLTFIPAKFQPSDSRRTGAGLIGTLAGVLSVGALPATARGQLLMLIGAFLVAVAVSDSAEEILGRHDDPRIVIDEWIGAWVAVCFLPRSAVTLALGFVLFRIFDVWKSAPLRAVSRWRGGWGIVADDVVAGVFANLILRLIAFAHPL